jgi:hypothetical protein
MLENDLTSLDRFIIDVPEDTLADLKRRLSATRWSRDLDNDDEFYGVSTRYLRSLAEYWVDGFD